MSEILARIQSLVARGDVFTSVHGFRELAADGILLDDVTNGVAAAIVVEEYSEAFQRPERARSPTRPKRKAASRSLGIPKGTEGPATIITAYRPKPSRWSSDFMRRT